MTDEQMDARLRAAGRRFRTTDAALFERERTGEVGEAHDVVTFDATRTVRHPRRPHHRAWFTAASAALIVAALAIGAVIAFGSRTGSSSTATSPIPADPTWAGVTVTSTGGRPQAATDVSLTFAHGRVEGSDGCNSIQARATQHDGIVTVGTVTSSAVGCLRGPSAAVDRILTGRVRYAVSGDTLTLDKARVGTLVLTAVRPARDAVVGTWGLTSTSTTHQSSRESTGSGSSALGTDVLTVTAGGRLTIKHRCDTQQATYRIDGHLIRFGQLKVTLALPCPAVADQTDEQRQDAIVDAVLTGAARWSVGHDQLTLVNGAHTATFANTRSGVQLTTTAWSLRTISQGTGAARPAPSAVTLGFSPGQAVCSCEARAATSVDGADLHFFAWKLGPRTLQNSTSAAALHFVFTRLLVGATTWSITDGVLTISKQGTGSITLTAHP